MTTTIFCPFSINRESRQTDSNRRPADYKSAALPTELCRHFPRKIAINLSSANFFLYDGAIFIALAAQRSARCDRLSGKSSLRPRFDRRGTIQLCQFGLRRDG